MCVLHLPCARSRGSSPREPGRGPVGRGRREMRRTLPQPRPASSAQPAQPRLLQRPGAPGTPRCWESSWRGARSPVPSPACSTAPWLQARCCSCRAAAEPRSLSLGALKGAAAQASGSTRGFRHFPPSRPMCHHPL